MRIISGKLGGRPLSGPGGAHTRPAMAKTREALFSILDAAAIDWSDINALDLFAGSGSLGFEALSRGAKTATFVDNGVPQCRLLAKNAEMLAVAPQCQIICRDVLHFLRSSPSNSFNLVFVDPPYRHELGPRAIMALCKQAWLAKNAFVAAELETGARISPPAQLALLTTRQYGQTCLHIWQNEPC